MHFLSHYYIDRPIAEPAFAVGALLPDLLPHFTALYNRRIRHLDSPPPIEFQHIHAGLLRHVEADKWFHSSAHFMAAAHAATLALRGMGDTASHYRYWFLGHIGVEMAIDRILCSRQPRLIEEYYSHIGAVDSKLITHYAHWLYKDTDSTTALTNFKRFMEAKFLYKVMEAGGAVQGMSRTHHRLTGVPISPADMPFFITTFDNIEANLRYTADLLIAIKPYALV
jgi:hypothetical protein